MEDIEIWKDIKDYEGLYQVSSHGRVKSLSRYRNCGKGCFLTTEIILKNVIDIHGYYQVNLHFKTKSKPFKIHKLVAIHFLNHIQNGYKIVVDHIDNNKLNNHVSNLQLISNRENTSKDKKNKTSNYTGVSWNKANCKWVSFICINKKINYLGYFENEYDAHLAYEKINNELKNEIYFNNIIT